jgi:hypothetical protein
LDWTPSGEEGRIRRLQEEYVEWRVVRDDVGIRRVKLTTELSDYSRQERGRAAKNSSAIHRSVLLFVFLGR